ncbi:MAG: FtsX-like permease family protein, partial [Chloroflexi bacterium]|nr:FtsX-like permease family protein [Chloroflexota bacterium]
VMLVLVIVSVGGYLAYYYVASYRSPLEFAVLRALGFTGRQLLALQALVHAFIITGAVLLGAWIGIRTHSVTITYLEHTDRGRAVQPPFAPQTDWSGVGIVLGVSALALVIIALAAMWSFNKTPVWRALRRGEG